MYDEGRASFGTRGSQVQILPLRPIFSILRRLRGLIWGTKLHVADRLHSIITAGEPAGDAVGIMLVPCAVRAGEAAVPQREIDLSYG
jgi:hypothetical protein